MGVSEPSKVLERHVLRCAELARPAVRLLSHVP